MNKEKTSCINKFFIWIKDVNEWLFDFEDWKRLMRSIPGSVVAAIAVSVVVMNLLAGKTIIMTDPSWLGITGGLLVSWIPFLCMDIVTKTYGARAAIKLNITALLINLVCIGFFELVSKIYIGPETASYEAFDATFSQTWQIFAASTIAFIVSGVANNIINSLIGRRFLEDPDGKKAYMARTYISTAIGQFIDNFVFTALAFLVFFKLSVGSSFGWTIYTVTGTAVFGAFLELLMEIIFSPIGYKICKLWRKEDVGRDYINYCRKMEKFKDSGRINF